MQTHIQSIAKKVRISPQTIPLKKTQKRKCDDVDILAEDEAKSSKRGKQNFADNLKQINEH